MDAANSERARAGFPRQAGGFHAAKLAACIAWARSHSLQALPFAGACCSPEMASLAGRREGGGWPGPALPHCSPRQADLLIVGGTITQRLAPVLRQVYEQLQAPRWVMAVGACACSGAPYDNYATLPGLEALLPVDIFVPGCPPRPEALLDGLARLQARVRNERTSR